MPRRRFELSDLRALCAAVELGSLSAAARRLGISQPAVSKRLSRLEEAIGTPLLTRTPTGVRPSAAGVRLYQEARGVLRAADRIEHLIAELRPARPGAERILLASSPTAAEYVLPARLASFGAMRADRPSIEILTANSHVVCDIVAEHGADLGVVALDPQLPPDERLARTPFVHGEIVVAVPPSHPWRALDEIPLDDFLTEPLVLRDPGANTRRIVDAGLAERGLELAAPLVEVGDNRAAKAVALSRGAPAVLGLLSVREDDQFAVRRVAGLRFPRTFAIVWPLARELSAPVDGLIEHLARNPLEVT